MLDTLSQRTVFCFCFFVENLFIPVELYPPPLLLVLKHFQFFSIPQPPDLVFICQNFLYITGYFMPSVFTFKTSSKLVVKREGENIKKKKKFKKNALVPSHYNTIKMFTSSRLTYSQHIFHERCSYEFICFELQHQKFLLICYLVLSQPQALGQGMTLCAILRVGRETISYNN